MNRTLQAALIALLFLLPVAYANPFRIETPPLGGPEVGPVPPVTNVGGPCHLQKVGGEQELEGLPVWYQFGGTNGNTGVLYFVPKSYTHELRGQWYFEGLCSTLEKIKRCVEKMTGDVHECSVGGRTCDKILLVYTCVPVGPSNPGSSSGTTGNTTTGGGNSTTDPPGSEPGSGGNSTADPPGSEAGSGDDSTAPPENPPAGESSDTEAQPNESSPEENAAEASPSRPRGNETSEP